MIDRHLAADETVLWRAKPERSQFLRRNRAISGLGLGFLGIAVFWMVVSIIFAGAVTPFLISILLLWGIPSLIVAALLILGPMVLTAREWTHTEYVLTDRRLLMQRGIFRPQVGVIDLRHLPATEVQRQDGIGNIVLLSGMALDILGEGGGQQYQPAALVLWNILEPDRVAAIIREAAERRTSRPSSPARPDQPAGSPGGDALL